MHIIADQLRAEAETMRASARQLLDSSNSGATVRSQLSGLLSLSTVDELHARLTQIIESLPARGEQVRLISTITGTVTANVYKGLADVVDGCLGVHAQSELSNKRRAQMQFNKQLNQAAAKGDWDEFERLTDKFARSHLGEGLENGSSSATTHGHEGPAVDHAEPGT